MCAGQKSLRAYKGEKKHSLLIFRREGCIISKRPVSSDDNDTELVLHVLTLKGETAAICVTLVIEGKTLKMKLETGAAVSLISTDIYETMLKNTPLQTTNVVLKTYTGEAVSPNGVITVNVKMNEQTALLPLYVVEGNYPSVLGREWLKQIYDSTGGK